jgi:hypothetical protein
LVNHKKQKMENTTPQGGVAIEPIVYPLNAGTATQMSVLILNFTTEATTCTTYWQLLSEDGLQLSQGNYTLTEEEFAAWGQDNNYVNQVVAAAIGVTLI